MQFNAYSQHLILYSYPSPSILMAFSFQSLTNNLRKKTTGFISKQTNCCRLLVHQNPWGSREKKSGRTNSEQLNFWHDRDLLQLFLEKENTAFSLPFKVFHDSELIQSQDEAVTNVQKLEKKNQKSNMSYIIQLEKSYYFEDNRRIFGKGRTFHNIANHLLRGNSKRTVQMKFKTLLYLCNAHCMTIVVERFWGTLLMLSEENLQHVYTHFSFAGLNYRTIVAYVNATDSRILSIRKEFLSQQN